MIEYQIYTTKDVREWIENGAKNGLSENIISLTRANALIQCPCVKEEDVLVISAKDGEKVVGYTAAFPEKLARPDLWIAVGTTLWVDPEYADDFVGYNLIQRLWNCYLEHCMIGSEVAPPAAIIDKLLGAIVLKYQRSAFVFKRTIKVNSFRSFGSFILEPYRRLRQRNALSTVRKSVPSGVRVIARNIIDKDAYTFIQTHSQSDTFLRSRDMLNWILQFPVCVQNPLYDRAIMHLDFSDQKKMSRNFFMHVYDGKQLIGIFLLAERDEIMHLKMLYADDKNKEFIYALIVEIMAHSNAEQLYSLYPQFNAYIASHGVSLKTYNRDILFTYPKSLKALEPMVLQGMEGDMFA